MQPRRGQQGKGLVADFQNDDLDPSGRDDWTMEHLTGVY